MEANFKMLGKGHITALIAVKGDSERIRQKNIRPFSDTNLLQLKLII